MQFIPLHPKVSLGLRADCAASFGNSPFYMQPFITLRGAPILRYQGEELAQIETEPPLAVLAALSIVGFVGGRGVWNDFERFDNHQSVVTGGTGFRYEIAREYGLHVGLDVAFAPENTAVYIQIGSGPWRGRDLRAPCIRESPRIASPPRASMPFSLQHGRAHLLPPVGHDQPHRSQHGDFRAAPGGHHRHS
jgi:hypothetical protein